MWCEICDYQTHEGCCEGCIGHTTDDRCVVPQLLEDEDREIVVGR
jgi:hypothetical protein